MLSRLSRVARVGGVIPSRAFHRSAPSQYKVAVVGAAGGIGQPLSLLLKLNPLVTQLSLYDVAPICPGVGVDLSHINTQAKVSAFSGDHMKEALDGADVLVIPAGVPRKPGMTRDDLFNVNAGIVASVARTATEKCPKAMMLIISNPVNSTVPIFAEVMKKHNVYDKRRVFGVTTLDIVRANTFVAEHQKIDVKKVNVPVIGGHAGTTILPLLSLVPGAKISDEDRDKLTHRIMFGGDEVVKAKAGGGSATLSMAYAGAHFADRVMRAMRGESNIIECTYVESTLIPELTFFSSQVILGKNGVEQILPLPQLSAFEKQKLEEAKPELKSSVQKGIDFIQKNSDKY